MKMSPKQTAVLQEISDGTVKLWVNGYSKIGERVLVAMNAGGCKVNLQLDWALRKGFAVLGETPVSVHDGQQVFITDRGFKNLLIAQNELARA